MNDPEQLPGGYKVLKWVVFTVGIFIALFIIGLLVFAYLYARSLRHYGIVEGRVLLRQAQKEYAESGTFTNYSGKTGRVRLSTNVVSVGGTQYQCFLTLTNARFQEAGALAMTTNQTFIWLDRDRGAKIIDASYRPPLFPPRF